MACVWYLYTPHIFSFILSLLNWFSLTITRYCFIYSPLEDSTTVRAQYELEPEPRRPGTDGAVRTVYHLLYFHLDSSLIWTLIYWSHLGHLYRIRL